MIQRSALHQWQQQQDVHSKVQKNYPVIETINAIQKQDRWSCIVLNSNDDSIGDADNSDDDNHHNNNMVTRGANIQSIHIINNNITVQ